MDYKDKQKQFLLIDDVMNNLITLKALILEAFPNSDVTIANNGDLGIHKAKRIQPDVILLDILMPHMDGFEVCKAIKSDPDLEDIPVVFVTALKSDKENRIKALACGGEAFLTKPVDEVELYVQLRSMLKIREKNRTAKREKKELQTLVAARTVELERLKEKYRSILDDLPGLVSEYLPDTTLTYVNQKYSEFYSVPGKDLLGKRYLDLISPGLVAKAKRSLTLLTPDQPVNLTVDRMEQNGRKVWVEWRNRAIFDRNGQATQYYSIGVDITERKKTEERLVHLSYHDHLTGLYNRRFFEEEMKRLDQSRNLPITIVMADVNGLKIVNDSFGHNDGDRLLKQVAEAMKEGFRADDIVARIGGDEFAVILPKTDAETAGKTVLRVKEKMKEKSKGNLLQSVSFGHDTKTMNDQDLNHIYIMAEDNMYRHKVYESSSMRSKVVELIMNSLFEKSQRELSHSTRVGEIAAAIAKQMGCSADHIMEIRIAGYIHDIGKIGVQESILNKNGKLSRDEWIEMKRHPEAGSRILSSVAEFKTIARYVLAHHERWDGKGYPHNLKGEMIPMQARIISVADAYDAMTAERTYRSVISKSEAIEEILRNSGSQFDPAVVDAFLQIDIPENFKQFETNVFSRLYSDKEGRLAFSG